nr:GspH/FimT family pseudopilin [uncultured Rhodopila sp.]
MISRNSTGGFTLIELLVVLLIMGLALSIVAGFASAGRTGLELASGTDEVANTLRLARVRAIARQQAVSFTVTADGHGYVLDAVARALPRTLTAAMDGAAAIRFAPDGSASGGAVRLAGGGRVRVVRVDWLTGRVTAGEAR